MGSIALLYLGQINTRKGLLMRGKLFDNTENTTNENKTFVAQNDFTLLVNLDGTIYAKQGSMIAYKGTVDFDYIGAGIGRFVKSVATGEGMSLMKVAGQGDVFLADRAAQIHVLDLENEALTITSRNVLAFTEGIDWDINVLKAGVMGFAAGGFFNTTLKGTGSISITSFGLPVVIAVDGNEVYADVNSIIAWTSDLQVSIKSSFKAKSLIGRGSGESFQMAFRGKGHIVVQPGEYLTARA